MKIITGKKQLLLMLLTIFFSMSAAAVADKGNVISSENKISGYDINCINIQENDTTDSTRVRASFPGGKEMLRRYIRENLRYPEDAARNKIQRRVVVVFIVQKDGSITGANVVDGINDSLSQEALRLVNAMPNWEPGRKNGKFVKTRMTLPINFILPTKQYKRDRKDKQIQNGL